MEINKIIHGNCLDVMKTLPDNCIDAIVTDPPYGLSFMGKKWDYDVPSQEIREECLRILKPGGYLLAFAGTRTQHRMAVRIEDAGFEIRDMIAWVYGSGFPKSLNIGKAVDKLQGNEREVSGYEERFGREGRKAKCGFKEEYVGASGTQDQSAMKPIMLPVSEEAKQWEGWGTALKPALEPITVARKPLGEKTVAENCLKWGVGGINIDESRVGSDTIKLNIYKKGVIPFGDVAHNKEGGFDEYEKTGRFPANLIHDGSDEVRECFPETKSKGHNPAMGKANPFGGDNNNPQEESYFNDSGNASRFFMKCEYTEDDIKNGQRFLYQAKASKSERNRGLDGRKIISIKGVVLLHKDNLGNTAQPDQRVLHLLDIERYQRSDTGEYEIEVKKGLDLNTSWYEKNITDQFLSECKLITKTETSSIIVSETLNLLRRCITREYTPDASGEIDFGESLVGNADGGAELKTTIKGKIEFLHDANNAVSEMQLIIREKENKNFHSTVKPIALMEYLVKLVTKEGGIVFDPFAGSGTTLLAAKKNGYQYLGTEMTEEYIPIIEARLNSI